MTEIYSTNITPDLKINLHQYTTDNTFAPITSTSTEQIHRSVDTLLDNELANSSDAPANTVSELSNQLKGIGSLVSTTQTPVNNAMSSQFKTGHRNSMTNLSTRAESVKYKYHDYFKHIHGFNELFEPSVARQYAHTFFVETFWMLCDNATDKATYEQLYEVLKETSGAYCNGSPQLFEQLQWRHKDTTVQQTPTEIYNNFVTGLTADVEAQHFVNIEMLTIDYNLRSDYLLSQQKLIDTVVQQQDVLIESLQAWSHYLDKQAQEYAQLYETLSTQMTTYKRKDVFDIQESNSLDIWNKWSTIIFWTMVVIFVLMVVVQHYRSLSSMAGKAEQQFKDTATKAYHAITQVKSK